MNSNESERVLSFPRLINSHSETIKGLAYLTKSVGGVEAITFTEGNSPFVFFSLRQACNFLELKQNIQISTNSPSIVFFEEVSKIESSNKSFVSASLLQSIYYAQNLNSNKPLKKLWQLLDNSIWENPFTYDPSFSSIVKVSIHYPAFVDFVIDGRKKYAPIVYA